MEIFMKKITSIQEIILPKDNFELSKLYCKVFDEYIELSGKNSITKIISFDSFFNILSVKKWKYYTNVNNIKLVIGGKGSFIVEIVSLGSSNKESVVLRQEVNLDQQDSESIISVPCDGLDLVFFRILCTENSPEIFYAYWGTDTEPQNDIKISIVICTFKKEKYIKKNMFLFKKLFETHKDLKDSLSIKIVDNGRTLQNTDILNCPNTTIYQNNNVGGAGGFTRGIIESIRTKEKYTHILLMDDDVEILPHSITLSFSFLSFLKDEFKHYFLGGSMLNIDDKTFQMASIEWFESKQLNISGVGGLDLTSRQNIINNNDIITHTNQYQAWWYCIVPISTFNFKNLPYPLFFRHDDIDFAIRNKANIMQLNGICVWHEPFYKKTNIFLEYLELRNKLILSATNNYLYENLVLKIIWKKFFNEIRAFNYNGATAYIDIFRHVLKGPSLLIDPKNCESILKSVSVKNEKLQPIENVYSPIKNRNLYQLIYNRQLGRIKSFIWRYTLNGHLLPIFPLKSKIGFGACSYYEPRNFYLRRKMIIIDPINKLAVYRKRSNLQMIKVVSNMIKYSVLYLIKRKNIRKKFKASYSYMTSIEFWDKYLHLDDNN